VLAHEGGFIRHPFDPGGMTNFGITHKTLAKSRGAPVTMDDVRRLSKREAASIYRRFYWDVLRADELPPGVALSLFDFAVNSGTPRAVRALQSLVGEQVDGVIGPRTIAAVRRTDPPDLVRRLTRRRLGFLARLATWPIFGRGWRRRVLSVEREALRLALASAPHQKDTSS
jgi:lysozyme family protein